MSNLRHAVTVIVLIGLAGIVIAAAFDHKVDRPAASAEPDFSAAVKGYKTWTHVNSKPYRMSRAVMLACAAPKPGEISPHTFPDAYIEVYVNPAGRAAMFSRERVAFPEGTIIVKEKHHSEEEPDPELLTVMLKRAKGYNPETGDWDFAVLDGKAGEVQAQGKLEKCIACHKTIPSTDYVFRPYLPR